MAPVRPWSSVPVASLVALLAAGPRLGTASAAASGDPEAPRPNVVLILADDLGYSDLGCYGGEIGTPNIDALAAGGLRFTQFYDSARCCPSRASLMTGLYPSQAGIGDFTTHSPSPDRGPGYLGRLNDRCLSLAELLKSAGYGCYYVGKWHLHPETGPIARGFDEFYGYTTGHSHDQYDADYYQRLPEGRAREIDPPADEYYATDVFNRYALEFIRQGQRSGEPWFLFLGHSSPHFPVQAPAERADRHEARYLRGWDVLREERYARMQDLGLVDGEHWGLTERSRVPTDRDDIANGSSGQPNPAWDSLDEDRRRDLARRMAVFAAMVEAVDQGVGAIVQHLAQTDELDDTLILFLSDNGACYEWGPFGFDGPSRAGTTTLHRGEELRRIGGPGTHQSYGSGWANLGNTPLRMYKHFTHEGGICTPFVAHWPAGIEGRGRWVRQPAHVMDVLPTLGELAGARYPAERGGLALHPVEGQSLVPCFEGGRLADRVLGFEHQGARALRRGDLKLVWSKRMPHEIRWELYDLARDRCERQDLAATQPERVREMAAEWEAWARRVGVIWPADRSVDDGAPPPAIAQRPLRIEVEVEGDALHGVAIAQGGDRYGYALHFDQGRPRFDLRIDRRLTRLELPDVVAGRVRLVAELRADRLTLQVGDAEPRSAPSPGLIPVQPQDGLCLGHDDDSAAGGYAPPNRLQGRVLRHSIRELRDGPPD